jgi:LPS O-antigen subunit length determinant protein (WzzB/FepE family)
MSSTTETAEARYRDAFERLKLGKPQLLPKGSPVSQNNVAKEAGTDTSALRLSRYPSLIGEIQTYVLNAGQEQAARKELEARRRRGRDDLKTQRSKFKMQRDNAQSQLLSAHRMVLELLQEKASLQARLDDLLPPPTALHR